MKHIVTSKLDICSLKELTLYLFNNGPLSLDEASAIADGLMRDGWVSVLVIENLNVSGLGNADTSTLVNRLGTNGCNAT